MDYGSTFLNDDKWVKDLVILKSQISIGIAVVETFFWKGPEAE